ncbi:transposase [Brasilonema sp. UFV-L1]|uniref:transposase n=1 Tax=Brasilonema sp. UFV-L1 TaxID=2234130 RepID=UPI00145F73A7
MSYITKTKTNTNTKKKTLRSSQAKTERVQNLRTEYWQKVQQIDPKNLVFIDEMGVLLGLARTHARSPDGSRVYDFKPFYRGAKVTVIGAISLEQVLAVMTLNGSMDGNAFKAFIEKCLLPQLWSRGLTRKKLGSLYTTSTRQSRQINKTKAAQFLGDNASGCCSCYG